MDWTAFVFFFGMLPTSCATFGTCPSRNIKFIDDCSASLLVINNNKKDSLISNSTDIRIKFQKISVLQIYIVKVNL